MDLKNFPNKYNNYKMYRYINKTSLEIFKTIQFVLLIVLAYEVCKNGAVLVVKYSKICFCDLGYFKSVILAYLYDLRFDEMGLFW